METVDFHKSKKKKSFSPMRRIAFSFYGDIDRFTFIGMSIF